LILVVDEDPYIRDTMNAALKAICNLLLLTSALGPEPVDVHGAIIRSPGCRQASPHFLTVSVRGGPPQL
jgi:hypothetical protein